MTISSDRWSYRLAWVLCFVMLLHCNWRGQHEIAGIFCVLMVLCSCIERIADRLDCIAAPRETKDSTIGAMTINEVNVELRYPPISPDDNLAPVT